MNRKGQAALEFLTTYGWALLVILVMIGALVYFGLLNPSKILPSKCTLTTGFVCSDYQIRNDTFSVVIVNKLGETIKNVSLVANPTSETYLGTGPTACTPDSTAPLVVNADESFTVTCTGSAAEMFGGIKDKITINMQLEYVISRQVYTKNLDVNLYSAVV